MNFTLDLTDDFALSTLDDENCEKTYCLASDLALTRTSTAAERTSYDRVAMKVRTETEIMKTKNETARQHITNQ